MKVRHVRRAAHDRLRYNNAPRYWSARMFRPSTGSRAQIREAFAALLSISAGLYTSRNNTDINASRG